MDRTKTTTQNDTKHVQHHDATDIYKNYIFVFFGFFLFILQEMLSYRLGTVNDFHWELKPVLSYSKPHYVESISDSHNAS